MSHRITFTTALVFVGIQLANAQHELFHIDGEEFDNFGAGLANPGDVDGDGTDDILVGKLILPAIRLYSGRTRTLLLEVNGPLVDFSIGQFITGLGDFDQDGTPDFAAGEVGHDSDDWANIGAVCVYSGADGSEIVFIEGENVPLYELGRQVAGLGDVNGDGIPDLGATTRWQRVRIYSGPDGTLLREHPNPFSEYSSIAALGDLDGDGCQDYVIGWPRDLLPVAWGGKVAVHSGRTGAVIHEVFGDLPGDHLGVSVAGVGDIDGDGVPDFAAGAPGIACTGAGCGAATRAFVRVYSGLDASVLFEWHGHEETDKSYGGLFGMWIHGGGGDINGDGFPEILVSAPEDHLASRGSMNVYSGRTGERLWRIVGEQSHSDLHVAAILGDLNHDGRADFAIGNPIVDYGGNSSGRVYVFGGDPGELTRHCTAAPTSVSAGIEIDASGAIGIGNNHLTLEASGAVPGQMALFFYGPPTAEAPFGDGFLCTGLPRFRLGPPLTVTPAGTLERPLDFTLPPLGLGPGKIHAGSTWSFQLFCRDPASPGGGTFNLSDALAITFPP